MKSKQLLRQYPVVVRKGEGKTEFYVADFYCHASKLIIEVDGGYHRKKEQKEDDELRDRLTAGLGLTTLRFDNDEVLVSTRSLCNRTTLYKRKRLSKNNRISKLR